ncbi:ribosome hibernation factor-recruiting GTPase MRF [Actinophytocola algeriensis]|uniref:G3E family GTPase n=1 Tax=Actinophytocola algeriensis TaxID=1768010 RepID=A0A7W7QCP0_9PSEU|nr:GTP-binding protein [Actinophytocola algeriensis]MBB4911122.1 G3E family GTPase [Actinophytocola algeriensis]MBE1479061.1 G3E family GTPase [Actinophytocola algeriensis]
MRDTRLVLVTGLDRGATGWVAGRLLHAEPDTVVVHHDMSALAEGIVRRSVRTEHGVPSETILELAHGCVSCTLREDTLPLLHALAAKPDVRRIVLQLDPGVEPEPVCWALHHALVGDATITDLVTIEAVVAVVDEGRWLAAATGDEPLDLTPGDDRTLAQVAVGQVEFADAIVVTGQAADGWAATRTAAVLDRLAPTAPRASSVHRLLDAIPDDARRGEVTDAHAPLLRWSPPLDPDCGVTITVFEARRPFHPGRLHDAIDVLLEGVVRARGRIWVATQPDVALWLESAGGGLRVGHAGAWLAAVGDDAWPRASAERRAKAAVEWHPRWGDRMQEIAIISHDASPGHLVATLRDALLSDEELAADWDRYEDPFTAREPLEDKA